jgi:poly-beta-1,6-N-acetyl-D-glucosamine synthase
MKFVFWGAAALVAYTYAGYPGWLWLRALWHQRPVRRGTYLPAISILMVVRDEEQLLERKLENLLNLDYPSDRIQLIIVSDGSTDGTEAILRRYAENPRVFILLNQLPHGKASGLNDAMNHAQGDIVVFTDARQRIEAGAVRLLVENFADTQIGCASGELMLESAHNGDGFGLYWNVEKQIRRWESDSGSVVGATGAFYAIRRDLFQPLSPGTILDDVYLPLQVVRQGYRVILDPRAKMWDQPGEREFVRKVRTLSGNYQLLRLAPWLLGGRNPIRFEFVSHKVLRLLAPFALVAMLAASFLARGDIYEWFFGLQLAFYGLSILGLLKLKRGPIARVADAACTFVVLNTAALVAFANFVTGRKTVWAR